MPQQTAQLRIFERVLFSNKAPESSQQGNKQRTELVAKAIKAKRKLQIAKRRGFEDKTKR